MIVPGNGETAKISQNDEEFLSRRNYKIKYAKR